MRIDLRKLRNIQRGIAKEVQLKDALKISDMKTFGAFDCAFFEDKVVCAGVVCDSSGKVLEKKTITRNCPMNFVPGYNAFREGSVILELFYDLEHNPDVLLLDDHGVLHPLKCGLATYVGVQLAKPTVGVARNLLVGEVNDEKISILNEVRGKIVITRQHANPLYVSPGNLLTIDSAVELVNKLVILPHKLPEPLHIAHRISKREAESHSTQREKSIEGIKKVVAETVEASV